MAHLSFALYAAYCDGVSMDLLARRLDLPPAFVEERIEAARLCFLMPSAQGNGDDDAAGS